VTAGGAWAQPAIPAGVEDTSFVEANGDRVLQLSAVIDAPGGNVWQTFSTAEGWKQLGVKMAAVDFRVGGVIETSYTAGAKPGDPGNIKNEIVAYVPDRLLAIRNVQAPPGFVHAEEFGRTATVIEMEPAEVGKTRLRITGVGFKPGTAFDDLYGKFLAGNAYTLDLLRKRWAEPAPK
jgi:uncharacterized protein YndB with AHSA1/START domain